MNTDQIDVICTKLDYAIKPYYRGTFALNNLIEHGIDYCDFATTNILIFNTVPSWKTYGHWLLLIRKPEVTIYFDSFNKPPEFYSEQLAKFIGKIIDDNTQPLRSADFRLQGDSKLCGVYCIFIAHKVAAGERLDNVLVNNFSKFEFAENDKTVLNWFIDQLYGDILKQACKGDQFMCLTYEELLNEHGKGGRN